MHALSPRSPQSLNNHNFYLFPIGFFVVVGKTSRRTKRGHRTEHRRQQTEDYTAARAKGVSCRERENVENWRFVEMKDTASVAASIYKKSQ